MVKQWKTGGAEDSFVLNEIRSGKITKKTSAKDLKDAYPEVFGEFNTGVIRNHLNVLKRAKGLLCKSLCQLIIKNIHKFSYISVNEESFEENDDDIEFNDPEASTSRGSTSVTAGMPLQHQNASQVLSVPRIRFNKYPVIVEQYTHPDTHYPMILVDLNMPSGSTGFQVLLNDEGTTMTVKFKWGKTMFDKDLLFNKELNQQHYQHFHPKLLAHENGLRKVRATASEEPEGSIEVDLPVKVLTDPSSWWFVGKKRNDGTVVVEAEFQCKADAYHQRSSQVEFEMPHYDYSIDQESFLIHILFKVLNGYKPTN